jgi:hypothetical protein
MNEEEEEPPEPTLRQVGDVLHPLRRRARERVCDMRVQEQLRQAVCRREADGVRSRDTKKFSAKASVGTRRLLTASPRESFWCVVRPP